MTALYLTFLIVGLAIFVVSMFADLGHDLDFHADHPGDLGGQELGEDSPGLFSIRTISAGLAGFGVVGLTTTLYWAWPVWAQLLGGFVVGFLFMLAAYGIMKAFYSQQAGKPITAHDTLGKNATITIGAGKQGIAQCNVDNRYYPCIVTNQKEDDLPLRLHEQVKVVSLSGSGDTLIVEKLNTY
jgi:membrane protein implicated in regulation of membrane protease activity